jgi:hypothetical protein
VINFTFKDGLRIGSYTSVSGGAEVGAVAGGGITVGIDFAKKIEDLNGLSTTIGLSSPAFPVPGDLSISMEGENAGKITGASVTFGATQGSPFEQHTLVTETSATEFSLYDIAKEIQEGARKTFEDILIPDGAEDFIIPLSW